MHLNHFIPFSLGIGTSTEHTLYCSPCPNEHLHNPLKFMQVLDLNYSLHVLSKQGNECVCFVDI